MRGGRRREGEEEEEKEEVGGTSWLKACLNFCRQSTNSSSLGGLERSVRTPSGGHRTWQRSVCLTEVSHRSHDSEEGGMIGVPVTHTNLLKQFGNKINKCIVEERSDSEIWSSLMGNSCQRADLWSAHPSLWFQQDLSMWTVLYCSISTFTAYFDWCGSAAFSPPGLFFLPFLFFFLLESSPKASAAFWSLVTKNSMSSRMWFRICCEKEKLCSGSFNVWFTFTVACRFPVCVI